MNVSKTSLQVVLESIADTFIPNIKESPDNALKSGPQVLNECTPEFLEFTPSKSIPGLGASIEEFLLTALPADKVSPVSMILSLLNTRVGTFLLTGYMIPFPQLNLNQRTIALLGFKNSWLQDLQNLFRALLAITSVNTFGNISGDDQNSPIKSLGYIYNDNQKELLQLGKDVPRPTILKTKEVGVSFFECDVVVVGSGCGGGLVAAELSKAGFKVILCEKASYSHPSDYNMSERDGLFQLYEQKGAFLSEDGSMSVLAGSAWGGGSTINWNASFKPPQSLLKEWSENSGLDFVLQKTFDQGVDKVWSTVGCTTKGVRHNIPNQILMDGCKKLNLEVHDIDQNASGKSHECGARCTFGCAGGVKNSTAFTYLQTAAKHGCKFMDGIYVDRIVHSNGMAHGVEGTKNGKKVMIKSRKVVCSGGSLNSPALLLRSSIPNLNPHVGCNLKLHPVSVVHGIFPGRQIESHIGPIMTAVSTYSDPEGYGYKLEVPFSIPGVFASSQSWESGFEHKRKMSLWKNTSSILVLVRDKDSEGRITVDSVGKPHLKWSLGKLDEKHLLKGLESAMRILIAEGAVEICIVFSSSNMEIDSSQLEMGSFIRDPKQEYDEVVSSKEFNDFVAKMNEIGCKPRKTLICSAHQMGSCRMNADPSLGAVSPRGRLYGTNDIYVADASVFPTASGVNPMITTYSMAHSISQSIIQDMQSENAPFAPRL